jgi:DNA-binding transcriptional MerR regulator
MYSIADLERMSGIKAHTIRIWEKRFKLFEPIRTETNRRIYSDTDLKRILNVKLLLEEGHKISHISVLSDEERAKMLFKEEQPNENGVISHQVMVNRIIEAAINYDETLFDKIFSHGLIHMGFVGLWSEVLLPALNRIGKLWISDNLAPAEEHFISNLITQKLNTAIDGQPRSNVGNKSFLLFLPEGDHHELGLIMCHYLLRSHRIKSVNLGENVPLENVSKAIKEHDFDYGLTFNIGISPSKKVIQKLLDLPAISGKPLIIAGSPLFLDDVENLDEGIIRISSMNELQDFITNLVSEPSLQSISS